MTSQAQRNSTTSLTASSPSARAPRTTACAMSSRSIDPGDGFLHFELIGYACEKEHLKAKEDDENATEMQNILDLKNQGKTIRDIACIMGMSKSSVGRVLKKAEAKAAAQASANPKQKKQSRKNSLSRRPKPKKLHFSKRRWNYENGIHI